MNTTISDAAVEVALNAYDRVVQSHAMSKDSNAMRAALEAALPHLQPAKPEDVRLRDELRERTPVDYAIEHAGYLVTAANQVIEARNELDALMMRQDEGGDVGDDEMQAAQEAVGDASHVLRLAIHEFEKRRDRAIAATGKQQGASPRYLTQRELDSIGRQAEGMDGEQWDRWVQRKFAEVNGFISMAFDDFTILDATGKQQVGEVPGRYHPAQRQADIEGRIEPSARELEGLHYEQVGEVQTVNADEAPFGLTTAEKVAWARGANDAIQEYAARQPAGAVPYGFVLDWKSALASFTTKAGVAAEHRDYKNCNVVPVYRAPPAQTVDLGEFREPVHYWLHAIAGYAKASTVFGPAACAAYAAKAEQAKRLLAVIDGQAVQS